jgi:general L-amino acid transport system substrate-binding protein
MRRIPRLVAAVVMALAGEALGAAAGATAGTLQAVIERGSLRCGVGEEAVAGFAARDDVTGWSGFDIDYCRAIAAAVLADADAVRFVPVAAAERFAAVASGRIDVLARNTAWTAARDGAGVEFPAVTFFDGQAFLVPRALGVRSALELDGARVCVLAGTTTLAQLDAFFAAHLMEHVILLFRGAPELFAAYEAGLCEAATADRSLLAGARRRLDAPDEHVILPELVAKDPLALVVAEGDPRWADVVRWVHMALLAAEERGLDQATARAGTAATEGVYGGLAAADGDVAAALGLAPGWTQRAVAAVGHYGELFARHLGPETQVGLDRGPNALWRDGGLHYPLPLR